MNSGAEAVETAIKVARKWGYLVKGVPENQATIVAMEGNFHGRTTTIVSFSTDAIATALAAYIRQMGYPAIAHHNGASEVQAIPIFYQVGFGELGRHGRALASGSIALPVVACFPVALRSAASPALVDRKLASLPGGPPSLSASPLPRRTASDSPAPINTQNAAAYRASSTSQIASGTDARRTSVMACSPA